jgi:hypothetical protein
VKPIEGNLETAGGLHAKYWSPSSIISFTDFGLRSFNQVRMSDGEFSNNCSRINKSFILLASSSFCGSKEYIKVKKAILKRYELTSEAYQRKFRNSRRAADETFAEWSVRLTRYVDQWIRHVLFSWIKILSLA